MVARIRDKLRYRYPGDWFERSGNSNIEVNSELTAQPIFTRLKFIMTNSSDFPSDSTTDIPQGDDTSIQTPRLWRDDGWTARVIKNEDDEGWAVEMIMDGESEPALVGPWTMGRDKKNPKPLDAPAFHTLVKTASEVLRRHEQQLHAQLHKKIAVEVEGTSYNITLDIVPDEDNPYALLTAFDAEGSELAKVQVAPSFKLNRESATAWVNKDFRRPN